MEIRTACATPCTTSRKIAEVFGKNHQVVLNAIILNIQEDNFREGLNGHGARVQKAQYLAEGGISKVEVLLNEHAALLLLMSFTTPFAMSWKNGMITGSITGLPVGL